MLDEIWMKRAFELAALGRSTCSPNPMVGCVIVYENRIIGEGWHQKAGMPHAEVNAIQSVEDKALLKESTLYVTLEPCSHWGRTPPCANRIVEMQIPRVVVANEDPNPKVSGNGIEWLRKNNIEVRTSVLSEVGEELNRFFFHFHRHKKPYIILKWAQSLDGFIDILRLNQERNSVAISGTLSHILSHKWRSEVDAILVGAQTAHTDLPSLTTRLWEGKSPIRLLIDPSQRIAEGPLTDSSIRTVRFSSMPKPSHSPFEEIQCTKPNVWDCILDMARENQWLSIMVEGGANTINRLLEMNLYNEARVFTSSHELKEGLAAPKIALTPAFKELIGNDTLNYYFNNK